MERKKDKATRKGRSGGERVRTRRRWKAEEKLSIIKEARESSSVAEVCTHVNFQAGSSLFYICLPSISDNLRSPVDRDGRTARHIFSSHTR